MQFLERNFIMDKLIFNFKPAFYTIALLITIWSVVEFSKYRKSSDLANKSKYLVISIYLLTVSILLFLSYSFDNSIIKFISFIPYPFSYLATGLLLSFLLKGYRYFLKYFVTKHFESIQKSSF